MAERGRTLRCPRCGEVVKVYRNPFPTVDVIIEMDDGRIVLIERRNPPFGWALPGGFVDYGESLEEAARREAEEETGLSLGQLRQFRAYSDPRRDPRFHTITVVFVATPEDRTAVPVAADDAKRCALFALDALPDALAFDHRAILSDYDAWKRGVKLL